MSDKIPLQRWTVRSNAEPVVRIGVVLGEDAMSAIDLQLSGDEYAIVSDAGEQVAGKGARVNAKLVGDQITLAIGEQPPKSAAKWRIAPRSMRAPKRGEGILVRDVVAGRGFHWQKH